MRIHSLLLAGAFVMGAASADATTPTLSGKYILSITDVCGLAAHPWPNGVATQFDGSFDPTIIVASFNSAKGRISASGANAGAQLIVPNSTGGSAFASSFAQHMDYSNTATTLTVGKQQYAVVYGDTKEGIAQHFEFAGTSTSKGLKTANCVDWGTAKIIS
jgi:hypothetical protein